MILDAFLNRQQPFLVSTLKGVEKRLLPCPNYICQPLPIALTSGTTGIKVLLKTQQEKTHLQAHFD